MTRLLLILALCGAASGVTKPGTVVTITATAQIMGGEPVTAISQLIVVKPWGRGHVYYAARYDRLMDGLMVRRVVGGVTRIGVQATSGGLFPLEAK